MTDARTDLFSLGAVLYRMATGILPFQGETSAVILDAILNREPPAIDQENPRMPTESGRILSKALEKDRNRRYQTATDLKTDMMRLKRDLESGTRRATELTDSRPGTSDRPAERSVAVLSFENLSGVKEDEYLRDGVTEDLITELSKIRGLKKLSRPTMLALRDKQVILEQIARKIAEALRITLSPREHQGLAAKPTDNLHVYDFYLRRKSYARRLRKQDVEFALQMFENGVSLGKTEVRRNMVQRGIQALETHSKEVREDARARTILADDYAVMGQPEDATREAKLAMALRPNEVTVLYNVACVFCHLGQRQEAMDALEKAWKAGFTDPDWARRDPDLALLHGDPELEELYPGSSGGSSSTAIVRIRPW